MSFDAKIFQNSYIMAITTFVVAYVALYLLGIGYETKTVDGTEVKSMSYKYPLVIALVVWLVWYFYLYPPSSSNLNTNNHNSNLSIVSEKSLPHYVPIDNQKMMTEYWY
jgi:hypothetical protein